MNYLLTLSFDGSLYHGWQIQNNAVSVQQRVQEAVSSLFDTQLAVTGCSRTDTGVHANTFCCNFRTDKSIPEAKIISGMNAYLPDSIAVRCCRTVPETFHARYDCTAKEYRYIILNSNVRDPFNVGRVLLYKYPLDALMLNEQAQDYLGEHDFSAFMASGSGVKSTVRTVYGCSVERTDREVVFTVRANGFLYNMVRIMVGTLLDISSGKIEQGKIKDIILSCDRSNAGATAAAEGLYLNRVWYEFGQA